MKITCDVCGKKMMIGSEVHSVTCSVCGAAHTMERVHEKLQDNHVEVSAHPETEAVECAKAEAAAHYGVANAGGVSRDDEFIIHATRDYSDAEVFENVVLEYIGTASTVILPDNVDIFGDPESRKSAFRHPELVKKFVFNDSVHTIGECAFYGCCNLEELHIPENVVQMWYTYNDGHHPNDDPHEYGNAHIFKGCTGLKRVIINCELFYDDNALFKGCTGLEYVKLPESIDLIGISMFEGCTSLKEIEIPQSVTVIAQNAFRGCTNLTNVKLPPHPIAIHPTAFMDTGYTPPYEYTTMHDVKKCPACGGKLSAWKECKKCGREVHYPQQEEW